MAALSKNGPGSRLRELAAVASALPRRTRNFLTPVRYPGMRLTPKRLLNQYIVRFEQGRGHTRLHGSPLVLTIESGNLCNLRCPYCHTGAGEVGRERSMFQIEQLRQLLDELGDTLLHIEFYNWGEPLLNKNIAEMINMASRRGIGSIIRTVARSPRRRYCS